MWIVDGDYVRLKNVEVGYEIPAKLLDNTPLKSIRIFANAYNLFTITDYPEADPEPLTSATNYPLTRIVNIGLSVNF